MTRDEAVALLKARLTRTNDSTLDAKIVTEMQFVQANVLEMGEIVPWFLITDHQTLATVAGDEKVAVPAGFLQEVETDALWILEDDGTYSPLRKESYDVIASLSDYEDSGQPEVYSLDDAYFRLRPVPDAIFTLRLRAFMRDTVLTTDIENNWLKWAPDLLIAETGAIIAGNYLRDSEMFTAFANEASRARDRLMRNDLARSNANQRLLMQFS